MALDCERAQLPTQDSSPELSSSRPAKRPRVSSDTDDATDTPEESLALVANEAGNRSDDISREHTWHGRHGSGLTSSFPPVEDLEVINNTNTPTGEVDSRTRKYTSSLYTDAFNLALDIVLAEESHLFSEQEAEIFRKYRSLPYEAQYLYVRLFLRKSATWFRVQKLGYNSNISDMLATCSILWSPEVEFAVNQDSINSVEEAAGLLTLEELKLIGKNEKFSGCTSKPQLIAALKKAATSQGRLQGKGQLSVRFDGKGGGYIKKILEITGPCIRLHPIAVTLFNRVHLVFYRSTEYTDDSLKNLILARTSKRNFPNYIVSRTANIFASHEILVEFEESIKLQAQVDGILEGNGVPTKDGLQQVLDIAESVYPRWLQLVEEERNKVKSIANTDLNPDSISSFGNENEILIERIYLRRFSPGWVLTRIIHKGLHSLGRFKAYLREHEILSQLLSQRFYHTARRGSWYQRKALIEEHYMATASPPSPPTSSETERKKEWLRLALDTCCKGLQDPLTNITFHYDLQKRIAKLEQKLKIPKREQHDFGYARLLKPTERTVYGIRIQLPVSNPNSSVSASGSDSNSTPSSNLSRKTLWFNPDHTASNPECSVEEMCLYHYRSLGWKGYHCEGSLMRTLFAYLFYDILFLYVPNVFETMYQTCPLDLFTEAFYPTRASEINHRLVEIGNGDAKRLVRGIWERENERGTCVVGLDWKYDVKELEEVVECIPGEGLAVVCKVLCQEYQQRSGGMPDLFLWNIEKKECMFAEVKSENDRLSDTQRLWIHVLSTAGIKVELCHALVNKELIADELEIKEM